MTTSMYILAPTHPVSSDIKALASMSEGLLLLLVFVISTCWFDYSLPSASVALRDQGLPSAEGYS